MPTNEEREARKAEQAARDARALANARRWEENATADEKAELEALRKRMPRSIG